MLSLDELSEIGFAVVTYPVAATFVVAKAMQAFMAYLAENGTTAGFDPNMLEFDDFNRIIDLEGLRTREEAWLNFAHNVSSGHKVTSGRKK